MGAKVLLIEDDLDLEQILDELLTAEGFDVTVTATPEEAVAAIERARHDLIVADFVVDFRGGDGWEALQAIRERAAPTPVGIFSGWKIDEAEAQRRGFVFALGKPASSEKLLEAIAGHATAPPLSAGQRRAIERYFDAIERGDWIGLGALCAEDVEYHLPGNDPEHSRRVRGRGELMAFASETFRVFREPRFAIDEIIPLPAGALVRYRSSWELNGNRPSSQGAIVFELRGEEISRIGIRVDVAQLGALAAGAR